VSLLHGFDAAYPPVKPYPNTQVAAGYIGGNTPHVWTLAEWLRFKDLLQLPIWTGFHEDDPVGHAKQACAAAHAHGWAPHAVARRVIALDQEVFNWTWATAFAVECEKLGYAVMPYASLSTLLGKVPAGFLGIWTADWDNVQKLPTNIPVLGAQYHGPVSWSGTQVDLDVFSSALAGHLGHGPRH
jgi:hypothetical protein